MLQLFLHALLLVVVLGLIALGGRVAARPDSLLLDRFHRVTMEGQKLPELGLADLD